MIIHIYTATPVIRLISVAIFLTIVFIRYILNGRTWMSGTVFARRIRGRPPSKRIIRIYPIRGKHCASSVRRISVHKIESVFETRSFERFSRNV